MFNIGREWQIYKVLVISQPIASGTEIAIFYDDGPTSVEVLMGSSFDKSFHSERKTIGFVREWALFYRARVRFYQMYGYVGMFIHNMRYRRYYNV